MLLDIEKFVRQLLPPNRRLPNHIGIFTTLLSPINKVIDDQNSYEYDAAFDTGTPAQVGVLQHILQTYVHPNILILDADGVRVDFRVIIPEGLDIYKRAAVERWLERYRLRSKRYEISVVPNWSNEGSDPTVGLAFLVDPVIVDLVLQVGVNLTGIYRVKIFSLVTGEIAVEQDFEFQAGTIRYFPLPSASLWRLELGSLRATIDAQVVETVTTAPAWITFVGYSFDSNSREASIWVNRTEDLRMKIESVNGTPLSGLSWNQVPWDNTSWIEGTTEWANPYSEVFRLNPIGSSGLNPGQEYRLSFVRVSNKTPVFTLTFTMPTTSQFLPPASIPLSTTPQLPACGRGPTVVSVGLATQSMITWLFDGDGVLSTKTHLKDMSSGNIIRDSVIEIATRDSSGNLYAIFSPSNQPRWVFNTPVPAGNYQLGIEGASCSSTVSWSSTFAINEEVIVDPGEPLDPQLGSYISYQRLRTFPGLMKLTETPVTGGVSYTDTVVTIPPSGFEVTYVINEKAHFGMGRMVDYVHQFPGPLSIRKCISRIGIPGLNVTGNGRPDDGTDQGAVPFMGYGAQFAQIDIIYIKQ